MLLLTTLQLRAFPVHCHLFPDLSPMKVVTLSNQLSLFTHPISPIPWSLSHLKFLGKPFFSRCFVSTIHFLLHYQKNPKKLVIFLVETAFGKSQFLIFRCLDYSLLHKVNFDLPKLFKPLGSQTLS